MQASYILFNYTPLLVKVKRFGSNFSMLSEHGKCVFVVFWEFQEFFREHSGWEGGGSISVQDVKSVLH